MGKAWLEKRGGGPWDRSPWAKQMLIPGRSGGTRCVGSADPDTSLKSFGFRIFSRPFDYADSKHAIYFAVRPREDRADFISIHGEIHGK